VRADTRRTNLLALVELFDEASRMKRVHPLAAVAIVLSLFGLCSLAASELYDRLLPGVPDAGRWPVSSLPWLLVQSATGGSRPWNDVDFAAVWFASCLVILCPVFAAGLLARSKSDPYVCIIPVSAIVAYCLAQIGETQIGYVRIFRDSFTPQASLSFIVAPMAWVVALTFVALAVAWAVKRMITTKT
jgi:hypothetical protein